MHFIYASHRIELAVQDVNVFKRKKWFYMILDEAHNIKNFRSQRWQALLHFNTKRRLMLTGTPLQNSLMELWSLMHFLMPHVFRSQKEFKYWFSNPSQALSKVIPVRSRGAAAPSYLACTRSCDHSCYVVSSRKLRNSCLKSTSMSSKCSCHGGRNFSTKIS